jgi:hypothetical protein
MKTGGLRLWLLLGFLLLGSLTHIYGTATDGLMQADEDVELTSALFDHLSWRNIGPANMVGRVSDVEGVPGDPNIVYVGSASGGIWKTTDGGITWVPIFDRQPVASIGDMALEPGNPDVIYV